MSFDKISQEYREKSIVQQKAAKKLLGLLKIKESQDVLDVGCGPGHVTNIIRGMTKGRVVGIDISGGMITQANKLYPDIEFSCIAAEDLCYDSEFDIVFCNSVLPWFKNPAKGIRSIFNSLKESGILGLACPGTSDWIPCFDRILVNVIENEKIKPIISHWKDPWFRLPTMDDYKQFFESQGFSTLSINVDYEQDYYTTDETFDIYLSAVANGYIIKKYYDIDIDDNYIGEFNDLVKSEIKKQSKDDKVNVDFNRLYYIGKK